jgi:hypothetical protein
VADFNPVEAFTKKYGPFPGYVWFGAIAVVGFFWIRTQQSKAGTLNADAGSPDSGEFSSSVTTEKDGTRTSYTASGPNSGFLGLVGQPLAGPMASSAGDIYVNLPGGVVGGKTQQTYTVPSKEMGLHAIADLFFGDDNFWRDIYRANAEVIGSNPWRDLTGVTLVIPDGETVWDEPKEHIPSWAEIGGTQKEKDLYTQLKNNPTKLASILREWSKENESTNKSLSIQQRDWANKLDPSK